MFTAHLIKLKKRKRKIYSIIAVIILLIAYLLLLFIMCLNEETKSNCEYIILGLLCMVSFIYGQFYYWAFSSIVNGKKYVMDEKEMAICVFNFFMGMAMSGYRIVSFIDGILNN